MKRHIPNLITELNLISGCIAVFYSFNAITTGNFALPLYFILVAAVFDFFDGFAARLLNARSELGKQLDSLADLISFGFAPGMIVVAIVLRSADTVPLALAFCGFLIPAFSALRLAKFNIDDRQSSSFLGLAVPANALFFCGLAYSHSEVLSAHPYLLLAITLFFSVLLVSEIPMFSLKFKNLKWRGNQIQYIFIIGAIILFVLFRFGAFSYIIAWYIIVSLFNNFTHKK
ncbi:MAG: CDP-diacylglycerol--serine O-phosphatidyltransferase [Paludibacter sp.]|jgi:CDP-diacylglycerol--serine O-phosphatidyltransferase|nr:CDP-diacylglycerol--serine O-phosphatidyltransferase [Paludibacter sp.]